MNELTDDIFEKILPKEKVLPEEKKGIKTKVEKVERLIPTEKKEAEEIPTQKIEQIKAALTETEKKINLLQEKIRSLEESMATMESVKKAKDFDSISQEIYEKLSQVEEAKTQIFIQSSKIQTKYFEIMKRLDELEYVIEKMKSFEKVFPLLEDLKKFDTEIQILRDSIEKLRLSIVEEKFYSLIAIIPTIKRKEILISFLDELDRIIDELKRNNMFKYDKVVLSSEVLESPNVKELKLV